MTPEGSWVVCSSYCANVVDVEELDNGIIYMLDRVILPSTDGTITDVIDSQPTFDILQAMLYLSGYNETLASAGNYTFFGPSDAAWINYVKATQLTCLLDGDHNDDLLEILKALTITDKVVAPFQFEDDVYYLPDGSSLIINVTTHEITVTVPTSPTTFVDITTNKTVIILDGLAEIEESIYTTNGILHVLDHALLPASYDSAWFSEHCAGTSVTHNLIISFAVLLLHFLM